MIQSSVLFAIRHHERITLYKFLFYNKIITCTCPNLNHSSVFCYYMHVHSMNYLLSYHQCSTMKHSQRRLLLKLKIMLSLNYLSILLSKLLLTDDKTHIMLNFLNFRLLQLNRNVWFISLLKLFDLNQFCTIIYNLFHCIHYLLIMFWYWLNTF